MYLPPNNDGAAALLETLHSMLVHESRAHDGAPRGLELAFATPRAWLASGKTISVSGAPTSFGPVSYSIARVGDAVHISVSPPPTPTVKLRLRLPAGERISTVEVDGGAVPFDRRSGTLDLSGRGGELELSAVITSRREAR
jgi:hypothetical protein